MAITPYRTTTDPLRPLFEEFLGSGWGGRLAGTDLLRTPEADVTESGDEIRVTMELAGLRPEDVEVNLEDNVLTVGGEKKEERREEGRDHRWHLSERRYGRFSRSFVLPRDVEQDGIRATFENGVLELTIPKSERARPRRIEIEGGNGRQRIETGTSR
ncbi:MAG TPA: Hsp20/alpha crystallin family protein [Longimicrobiaceae bacterium]|nr:Hsp20/alpha crystallin family protein [Longimicrobiaceae bacterium]